jgi:hypothetical protein
MTIVGVVSREFGGGVAIAVHEGTEYEWIYDGVAGSWFRVYPGQA